MDNTYSKSDITNWLFKYFAIDRISGSEVNFPCPFCNHRAFYFNVVKTLGFCHSDQCHRNVNLEDLIDIVGSEPDLFSGYSPHFKEEKKPEVNVTLPVYAKNIIDSNDLWAISCLAHRHVTLSDIKKFNIHSSPTMIFVPVYFQSKLVQYVGRAIDRSIPPEQGFKKTGKRYLYHEGIRITDHFFGWDECRLWQDLVLVENTFNSIWLRDKLHCTTNFGSFLSENQIKKLVNSYVKSVVLLWDEGAHLRSEQAIRALKKTGIRCVSVKIVGQPDDYSYEDLKAIIEQARETMVTNPEINFI